MELRNWLEKSAKIIKRLVQNDHFETNFYTTKYYQTSNFPMIFDYQN